MRQRERRCRAGVGAPNKQKERTSSQLEGQKGGVMGHRHCWFKENRGVGVLRKFSVEFLSSVSCGVLVEWDEYTRLIY